MMSREQLEWYRKNWGGTCDERDELLTEIDRLRAALEYYAGGAWLTPWLDNAKHAREALGIKK
jgi:hypothetical protein